MNSGQLYKSKDNAMEYNDSKAKSTPVAMVAPELKQSTDNSEISRTCAVLGCEDSKSLDPEMFFRFPEEPSQRQIWTELTGRNNWTPTDYSYMCHQHFSVDCFMCNDKDEIVLVDKAVPSLKLPKHVLEVEYIEEETLDNEIEEEEYLDTDDEEPEYNRNGKLQYESSKRTTTENIELLKLFTEVQRMQRTCLGLREKLKINMRMHNRQTRFLQRVKEMTEVKKKILNQKRKKKCRILLSLQDKIKEDQTGLVLAMPMRQTEDLKNFALSVYKYSPQSYIYIRNMLRTMLPSTEVLESWLSSGYRPKNVMSGSNNTVRVVAEQTEKELSCKITLG